MENIKSLAVGVCTAMIVLGAISLLIPEGSLYKSLQSLLSAALIAVIITGASGVKVEFGSLTIEEQTVSEKSEQLKETVTMQEMAVSESALEQYILDELNKNGITDAEISVTADISDKGDIYINKVDIVCEKGQSKICEAVLNSLNIKAQITERE